MLPFVFPGDFQTVCHDRFCVGECRRRTDLPTASTKPAAITAEQVTAEIAKFKLELINVPGSTASSVDSTRLRNQQEQATVLNLATNLGVWIDQGNYESALTTIQYVMERTQNPAYRKSLSALAVSITALQASERASFPQRVRSLVQAIPEQMRKAKTREDLEAFEIEMSRVMQHFNQAGIPDAIRHVMEDQVQQLQHEMALCWTLFGNARRRSRRGS